MCKKYNSSRHGLDVTLAPAFLFASRRARRTELRARAFPQRHAF